MPRRNLFDAIDVHLDRREIRELTEGRIVAMNGLTATVRLVGSSDAQEADLAKGIVAEAGDDVVLVRPRGRRRWIVVSAFASPRQGMKPTTAAPNQPGARGSLFPPNNIQSEDLLPGIVVLKWDAPPQEPLVFEVQTNTQAQESGAASVLKTRGSYAIIKNAYGMYLRVRSWRSDFQVSAWSPWVYSAAGTSAGASATSSIGSITLTISFNQGKAVATLLADAPSGARLRRIIIEVLTPAAGGAPTISIGSAGDDDMYMLASESDLRTAGKYIIDLVDTIAYPRSVYAYIAADGQTFSGNIHLTYTPA